MENNLPVKSDSIAVTAPVFYSPSAIVAIFNAGLSIKAERKIIQMRGIFKKEGKANYGGSYYDRLKDEGADNQITLITSEIIHNQLDDNKTIEFNGFITRKIDKNGRIEIMINLIELISQTVNKYSAEEIKKIELINKKVSQAHKDLDAFIKSSIFNSKPIIVRVVMGKSGIIDSDIKKGMGGAISLYNIQYHKISLSSVSEIITAIQAANSSEAEIICFARGGGENLEIFENLQICTALLECNKIIASAIGHAENVTLFEKLSDKKFITPTQFGNYLKEIYNNSIEELQQSKAKMVKDVETQLNTVYGKKIENLTQQLKANEDLHRKALEETIKNYSEQVNVLQNKIKSFEELTRKATADTSQVHQAEVAVLKKEIEQLHTVYAKQVNEIRTLESEKIKALNSQIQNLEKHQAGLTTTHNDQLAQIQTAHNSQIQNLEKQRAEMTTNYNNQIAHTQASLKSQIQNLEKQQSEMTTNHKNQVTQIQALQVEKTVALTSQIQSLQKQQSEMTTNHKDQLAQNQALQNEKIEALTSQIKNLRNQEAQKDDLLRHANDLANQYKQRAEYAEQQKGVSTGMVIILIIVAIVIVILIFALS